MFEKHVRVPSSVALLAATASLPAATPPPAEISRPDTNQAPLTVPGTGAFTASLLTTFEYTNAPLSRVLDHIAERSGLIIFSAVDTTSKVSLTVRGEVSNSNLIEALSAALAPHNLHLDISGALLKILPGSAAKYTGPVTFLLRDAQVPKSATVSTVILPLTNIEPVGLISTLQSYLPNNTLAIASADANALVLHGRQRDLSRLITIARLLDGAPPSASQIKVVPLQFADSTPMAEMIRGIFSGENSAALPNTPAGTTTLTESGTSPSRANSRRSEALIAAPDTHSNSLIMRGPAEAVYAAELLAHRLDTRRFEASEINIFRLRYADATEIATVVSGIFPKGSTDEFQLETTSAPPVEGRDDVTAVSDARSNTIILRAPSSIVPTLAGLIEALDHDSDKVQKVTIFKLSNADPVNVAARLQELFQANGSTAASSTPPATSALIQRAQQQQPAIAVPAPPSQRNQ